MSPARLNRVAVPPEPLPVPDEKVQAVRGAILDWYRAGHRDLPWRRTRDPYAVLVSEIMLQQTQVDRVIPKYHQFLSLYPTLEALAAAPRAEVIRSWAPLGYNPRAVAGAVPVQDRAPHGLHFLVRYGQGLRRNGHPVQTCR